MELEPEYKPTQASLHKLQYKLLLLLPYLGKDKWRRERAHRCPERQTYIFRFNTDVFTEFLHAFGTHHIVSSCRMQGHMS